MRMISRLFVSAFLSLFILSNFNQAIASPQLPSVDGKVYALDSDGTTLYVGGQFKYIGATTGPFALMNATSAALTSGVPIPNGTILSIISDGTGGWYIGGDFTQIGSVAIKHLAHIKSDNTLDTTFAPQPNDTVRVLLLSGSTLYAGGDFTFIGGKKTAGVGSLDSTTGISSTSFQVTTDQTAFSVYALNLNSTKLYVGGSFSYLGTAASNIVTLNATTGIAASPTISADAAVYALARNGNTLYIGGSFSQVNSTSRNHLAAVNATNGAIAGWDPNADSNVRSMLFDGSSTIYVAGDFSGAGGQVRLGLAAIDSGSGNATSFDIGDNLLSQGNSLALSGSTLYAGADAFITDYSGAANTVPGLVAFNATTGSQISFSPNPRGYVKAVAVSGSTLAAGGNFPFFGGTARNNVAAVTLSTGDITSWNPNANSSVTAIKVSGDKIYLGGGFSTIGGTARSTSALVDSAGTLQSFNPNLDGSRAVYAIDNGTLYIAGDFTTAGGQSRVGAAAFDIASGNLTSWNPGLDNSATTITVDSNTVYLTGDFNTVGGQSRSGIAAVSTSGAGAVTSWNPSMVGSDVLCSIAQDGSLYAGGSITAMSSLVRVAAGALSESTGSATSWNPDITPYYSTSYTTTLYTLAQDGTNAYLGGRFTGIQNTNTTNLASVALSDGSLNSWHPNPDDTVQALHVNGATVIAGGEFLRILDKFQRGLAVVSPLAPNTDIGAPTGTAKDGSVLTADDGNWAGVGTVTFTRQWERCNEDGARCYDISGETGTTYTLTKTDVGNTIRVTVTATDDESSTSDTSVVTAIINPLNTKLPKISGNARVGSTLTTTRGSWNTLTDLSFDYAWERCNKSLSRCSTIARASRSHYRIQRRDLGKKIRAVVTASKNGSTGTAARSRASKLVS